MTHTWPDVLTALVHRQDLDTPTTQWAMDAILAGEATSAQIAAFAVALRAKGETKAELQGLVDAMLGRAHRLTVDGRVVDVVGTGGDRAKTVNISSMAAVVTAGAGIGVVKHGNRAASSASGTADVFEVLGIALDVPADRVLDVYRQAGITFCFAPLFHGSMRHAGPTRGELAIPTFFNFLGPLTNPAQPAASAIGCFDATMAPLMAGVLADRGADAFVFRGDDGLDELTTTTTSRVWVVSGGSVSEESLDPRDLGLTLSTTEDLRGGAPVFNAHVFRRLVEGEISPVRDAVLLNAGAAIAAHAGGEHDLVARIAAGIERATESIDSGAAATTLRRWAEATQVFRN
ncbi:MAG: anthranilate phosphoribosyltransferase [Aeromicrobium sp.]|uniref:anthranilate phosphoribosyltransferase n=1 Tax=Aeromicrobium sp. TaxID=1871063 RepID=UPI003C437BFF